MLIIVASHHSCHTICCWQRLFMFTSAKNFRFLVFSKMWHSRIHMHSQPPFLTKNILSVMFTLEDCKICFTEFKHDQRGKVLGITHTWPVQTVLLQKLFQNMPPPSFSALKPHTCQSPHPPKTSSNLQLFFHISVKSVMLSFFSMHSLPIFSLHRCSANLVVK